MLELDMNAFIVNNLVTSGLIDEPFSEARFSACHGDDGVQDCSLHELYGVCAL